MHSARPARWYIRWAEVNGERVGQGLADTEWLHDAGTRGWVVLMKDDKIRYRPAELEALMAAGVCAFCVTNANLGGRATAERWGVPHRCRISRLSNVRRAMPWVGPAQRTGSPPAARSTVTTSVLQGRDPSKLLRPYQSMPTAAATSAHKQLAASRERVLTRTRCRCRWPGTVGLGSAARRRHYRWE
jgi:hypothetical protein